MTAPVAVTGAAGFVGQAVVGALLASGRPVRALVHRRDLDISHARLETVRGGLDDAVALRRLMTGCAAVVHVAGVVRGRGPADFEPVNADGAERVARIAAEVCAAPRVVLVSSLAARAPQLSPYAASKRAGEERLARRAAEGGLSCAVLRPPAIYGPGDQELLPLLRLMARGVTPLPGVRGARASLLHVDDLAAAIVATLDSGAEGTFELHDGRPGGYAWDEIAGIAESLAGRGRGWRVPIPAALLHAVAAVNLAAARVIGYRPMLSPGKVNELRHPDWVCDNTGITRATGWLPRRDLRAGLGPLLKGAPGASDEGLTHVI